MNKYLKEFLNRGLMFAGFGPIIIGIIFTILERAVQDFSLNASQVLLAIVSTYVIACVQAGASVFNQIEHWPIAKSLLCHFLMLYAVYVGAYLLNSWIPFEPIVVAVFTAIFAVCYFAVWLCVYLIVRATQKKLNNRIK